MLDRPHIRRPGSAVPRPTVLHVGRAGQAAGAIDRLAAAAGYRLIRLTLTESAARLAFGLEPDRPGGPDRNAERLAGSWLGGPPGPGRVLRFAEQALRRRGLSPDFVQAEGLRADAHLAGLLARRLRRPLVLAVADDSGPSRLLSLPALRDRRLVQTAAVTFLRPVWNRPAPAWLAERDLHAVRLPEVAANAVEAIAARRPMRGLLAVLPLDSWRSNGLRDLLWALAIARKRHPELQLDVVGSGSARATNGLRAFLGQLGLSHSVRLLGSLSHAELLEALPEYLALLLPGGAGPFAMLPAEALFAGVPLLAAPLTDPLGFLASLPVGAHADPRNVEETAEALSSLHEENERYRAAIAAAAAELHDRFGPAGVTAAYGVGIRGLLSGVSGAAVPSEPDLAVPEGAWVPGE